MLTSTIAGDAYTLSDLASMYRDARSRARRPHRVISIEWRLAHRVRAIEPAIAPPILEG
jgi:hypothetical protein